MSRTNRRDFIKYTLAGAAALGSGFNPFMSAKAAESKTIRIPGKVDRRILGKTGIEVSVIGLGFGSVFKRNHDPEVAERVMTEALELGINYFDTAEQYGTEPLIGPFVGKHRDKIFLVTKSLKRDYDGFMRDCEKSLKQLQTDHIDLLHIHSIQTANDPEISASKLPGCVLAARKLKEEGTIRAFGITGHSGAGIMMDAIRAWNPDVMMTVITSLRNRDNDQGRYVTELLPLARERNMGVVAMKTVRRADEEILKGPMPVRYPLSLEGVHVANIGLDLGTLDLHRSNVETATNFTPLTETEQALLLGRNQYALAGKSEPWAAPGYVDGAFA